jgi:hypothetical protein
MPSPVGVIPEFLTPGNLPCDRRHGPVNLVDENTLTLTMPALEAGPQDIALKNSDGSSYTLENGVNVP